MNIHSRVHSLLTLAGLGLIPLLFSGEVAHAESSAAGEEFLSSAEAVPPNVIFLLDLSSKMDETCGEREDDTGATSTDGDSGDSGSPLGGDDQTCLEAAVEAIDQLTQHYDWAYFGIVGTTDSVNSDTFEKIAPLGSSHAEISAALETVTSSGTDVRNLSEALAGLGDEYLNISTSTSSDDWQNAPISYDCQETHIITITVGPPDKDDDPAISTTSGMSKDVICDEDYLKDDHVDWNGSDQNCLYDNVGTYLYDNDLRSDLDDTQNAIVHTVGIKISGTDLAEELYGNTSDQTGNVGIYNVANQGDEILGSIMTIMSFIRSGFYTRSTPVLNAAGDRLIYSFYEISGDNPLAEGHIRAYEIDVDPESDSYGQIIDDDGKDQFGGALWDGGDLLVSRPVEPSESNPDLRQGEGQRDIYTWVPELASDRTVWSDDHNGDGNEARMGFDVNFAEALQTDSSLVQYFLDDSDDDGDGVPDDDAYDLNIDGVVDHEDMQTLIDFARGLPSATYRYLDQERGYWKLGDSPHAVPVVASPRNNIYTADPTYKRFLEQLQNGYTPETVFMPANDGMLHAFRMIDEEPATGTSNPDRGDEEDDDLAGEEMWAWLPGYILYANAADTETWSGRLVDLIWYGRTFLFDGSPVIEDVWIDEDNDGVKSCTTVPGDCEWHRILVVQQGKGGPVTLALDITDIDEPEFLWEQVNESDWSANAYTVSRPVIGLVRDLEDADDPRDRWVALWGSGRAVPESSSEDYYTSAEANIYMWHVSARDTTLGGFSDATFYDDQGDNDHPEPSDAPTDSDGRYEYGYISGSLAAVDTNSDGDIDVVYFPVTTAYEPSDMSDADGDGSSGTDDVSDPGYTWMYKAIIDSSDPDDMEWCEFLDPYDNDHGFQIERPEVYYAATTSFLADGSLGVYWGTGTPYDRMTTDDGYFFAFQDNSPNTCPANAEPLCEDGYYTLEDPGEGMTGDPIVYAGVVYFTTYAPGTDSSGDADYCATGQGRVYGLDFATCTGALDTDGDGTLEDSMEVDGYPSSLTISETGSVFVGSSAMEDSDTVVDSITDYTAGADPFNGIETMGRREVF